MSYQGEGAYAFEPDDRDLRAVYSYAQPKRGDMSAEDYAEVVRVSTMTVYDLHDNICTSCSSSLSLLFLLYRSIALISGAWFSKRCCTLNCIVM